MSKVLKAWQNFGGGISDTAHTSPTPNSYYFGRSIDVRTEPRHVGVLPRTVKESGSVVTDLVKWGDIYNSTLDVYLYGNAGNIYKRTSSRVYSNLRTVANSHGNGMALNLEDNSLYYTTDTTVGRYGPLTGTPTFADDYFGSQGGVPLNTNSLDLEATSSQYASRADTASSSITGNLSISAQIWPESLPTVGNSMVIFSKWDESGTLRSYKFDIYALSGYFGDGSDGALSISANTTEAPIDSSCSGTSGTTSLSATNVSFVAGQIILIHQSRGTGAGTWQRNSIASYTAGTITLENALNATYTDSGASQAQVRVLKQYTNVTINSGITYTAKAWDGNVGGILAFVASGTVTITGTITATGKGFLGGSGFGATSSTHTSYQGEGTSGARDTQSNSANGNGGGGGNGGNPGRSGGGGGGHSSSGSSGSQHSGQPAGTGGGTAGSSDLTTMVFGGGGGSGGADSGDASAGGANGGGILFITGTTITVTGAMSSNGNSASSEVQAGGGGGGAGGSVLLKSQVSTLGSSLVTASAGAGGDSVNTGDGGNGSVGRIHLDYYTSYTGTTSPTLDVAQDSNLVTTTTYRLRLHISSTGLNSEILYKDTTFSTSNFQQIGVSWKASTSTATFFLNTASIGTSVGALTAIHDNTSTPALGASFNGAGSAANFYDGLIDEVKVFNVERTVDDFFNESNQQIPVNTAGMIAYYKLNGDYVDAVAGNNTLTAVNTPVFSSTVPFSSPTTRLDIDQTATTTGNTYALATTISEGATHRLSFTPSKDPQKSIAVYVSAVGTGNWTLTVHDSNNNTVASKTVAVASMATGLYEFIFDSVWRVPTNFTSEYHFHLTSTVADGTVRSTTSNDLETVTYTTYYQFLVEDTAWHPIARFLNFIVIGNERYVAKYEVPLYEPNRLTFGAGWRARCFGYWQEYLVIGCMRGTNIYDYDQGRIYFWDGYSPTFNFYIDIPEGGVNALLGTRGELYIWAGWHADMLIYEGGSSARKLKEIPLIEDSKYLEVYPQAVTMWQSNVRFGVGGNSDSATVNKAVYTYGSKNYQYPDILTCDYPVSTGNYLDTVDIGMILPFSKELLVSWKDNVSYGVDYINQSNNPYPTAYLQMMTEDVEMSYKEKQAVSLVATFDPLLTGESINVKYMNEETDTDWNTNSDSPSTGDISIRRIISDGRFFHESIAVDITSSTTSPTLKSIVLEVDKNESEDRIG